MKKIYTLLLFLVIGFAGRAQSYIPFPDSGAVWVNGFYQVTSSQDWPSPHCVFTYAQNLCVNGEDTIINSTAYTKVEYCEQGTYYGAIRDDNNGKVFYVQEYDSVEVLLYDFTVNIGDTIYAETYGMTDDFEVNQIDSVLIFGEYRKRIVVYDGIWVEGIGNTWEGLFGWNFANVSGGCRELECMSINDSTLWPSEGIGTCQLDLGTDLIDFDFELFPNPSSDGIVTIRHNLTAEQLNYRIFEPSGQVVQEGKLESDQIDLGAEAGIYFVQVSNGLGTVIRRIIVQ